MHNYTQAAGAYQFQLFQEGKMEFFSMKEICIPISQIVLLLLLSTAALYVFTLYWGYGINRDYLVGLGFQHISGYTIVYFGFGVIIAVLALVSLIVESK
jgi:hypothetical protein